MSSSPTPTGTEAEVCRDIAARQQLGLRKYGTSVADNPLTTEQWLQHAYEEALDLAVYLKRTMRDLKNKTTNAEIQSNTHDNPDV